MVKEAQKKNLSSTQVMKTLNALLEGDYTMNELVQILNEREEDSIFNNSVISKYINTCRYCGIDIVKIHNKYCVAKFPFGLVLDDAEVEMLQKLKDVVTEEMSKKTCEKYQRLVDKLNRYADKKITRVEKTFYVALFEAFEKAINNKKRVKLLFKNRYELTGIPVTISKENGKTFLHVHSKNRIRMIDVTRLSAVQVTDENFVGYMDEQNIVFTLKGALAKRYELREEEKILNSSEDFVTISNSSKNSERLLSRFMRYDNLCEVTGPSYVRERMRTMIDDTLKNYGID